MVGTMVGVWPGTEVSGAWGQSCSEGIAWQVDGMLVRGVAWQGGIGMATGVSLEEGPGWDVGGACLQGRGGVLTQGGDTGLVGRRVGFGRETQELPCWATGDGAGSAVGDAGQAWRGDVKECWQVTAWAISE